MKEDAEKPQNVPTPQSGFDFSKSRTQMVIISSVRLGFHVAILFIILGFQALQPEFVNFEVLLPVYVLMAVAFTINATYLVFFDEALNKWPVTAFLFFFESAFITGLIHFTGVNQSIFLFLYLVNIILCGFVFQRRGANVLSLWTSSLFSFLMIMGPELRGQALFFAVGLNNIAFFAVAGLAGYLSEQLDFMGRSLEAQGKDLRALQNLQALIVDNMATGLITTDSEGLCLQANRAAFDILDPIPREIVGRPLEKILPGAFAEVLATRDGNERASRFDWIYQNPFQGRQTLELVVSKLPQHLAGTGTRISDGYIITFHDLTRVRRLEFAMRQSEKMAAVGQLAAGIAHEIRNPLASMSGSIQLLESSFPAVDSEERRLMKIVLREIDRLNNLITEFLDFVRPDLIKDDPVDVNSLLKDVLEMVKLNPAMRKDVIQDTEFQATRKIQGHRDKLKQAMLNIVINAYQAMNETKNPVIKVKTIDRDSSVVVTIRDQGCGIDEVGLRRIFEPFHTTKPKGTGLGLAITHKIIENHAGRIFVESTKGVGTEFTIEFRLNPGDVRQISLADSQRASEDFSKAFRGQKRS